MSDESLEQPSPLKNAPSHASSDTRLMTPDAQAMTREQVLKIADKVFRHYPFKHELNYWLAHDAAQRETIRRLEGERDEAWAHHRGHCRIADAYNEEMKTLQARLTASEAKHKWTKKPPTVAGWYWVRFTNNQWICTGPEDEWCVVQVWEEDGRMVCSIMESKPLSELNCGFTEWSGPINTPSQGPLTPGEE